MKMNKKLNIIVITLASIVLLYSKEPFLEYKEDKYYYPQKINDSSIIIDGEINEAVWENAVLLTDFIQAEPIYNVEPTKKTEVKLLYSNEAIYVSVHLFEDINNIKTKHTFYDDWYNGFDNNADYFVVEIDSRHNHQDSYGFAVNSSGVQADYMLNNHGVIDDAWNEYWESAVSIKDEGLFIEYKIPLSILKYSSNSDMGINFIRYMHNKKELNYWVLLPPQFDGLVSHYGHIKDLDIPKKKNIIIRPYFILGNTENKNSYYEYDFSSHEEVLDFENFKSYIDNIRKDRIGFDIKYMFNNHINIEYAFNPSEGIVEQNPDEINLNSYEYSKPEKRPFFTNNMSIFDTPISIFYSNRVGSNIFYNDFSYNTVISNALKLYGESKQNLSYGIILSNMEIDEKVDFYSKIKSSVVRMRRTIFNETSYVGLMSTRYKDFRYRTNVYSVDGLINLYDNRLTFDGQSVIARINKNENSYGHSYELSYEDRIKSSIQFLNNKIVDSWITYKKFSKEFDINNIGYLQRNNIEKLDLGLAFRTINPNDNVIERILNIQSTYSVNMENVNIGKEVLITWKTHLRNHWNINLGYLKILEHYDDWLLSDNSNMLFQDSIIVKIPETDEMNISFRSDPAKLLSFNFDLNYFHDKINDYGGRYKVNILIKPISLLSIDLAYSYDSYSNKYNFLKIRQLFPDPPPPPPSGNIIRNNYSEKYYFSNSDIMNKQIELLVSAYIFKNVNIDIFTRYFSYYNSYPNFYYKFENNFEYPTEIEFISEDQKQSDMLLYSSIFSSLEFNYILKWSLSRKTNFYFVYSASKLISGIKFKNIKSFLAHEPNNSTEIFYDQSFVFKFDFLIN